MVKKFTGGVKPLDITAGWQSIDLNKGFHLLGHSTVSSQLKYGFCKKSLLSECTSYQLNTFLSLFGTCSTRGTPKWWKKCSTGQRCIRKEVTSYEINILSLWLPALPTRNLLALLLLFYSFMKLLFSVR